MAADREFDIVLFGASGFVGRLTAGYLAEYAPEGTRIALAGRSRAKMAEVGDGTGWPVLVADAHDPHSMAELAGRTRVVVSTVGPYARHGLNLVAECAKAGTDYADLTGEVLFMRETIARYHELAQASGARIVHSCGFDSIPSDLGVLLAYQAAAADQAGGLLGTTLVVTRLKGGFSGGTLASAMGEWDEIRSDPGQRKNAGDPFALSPDRTSEPHLGRQPDLQRVGLDRELGIWVGPFPMAAINTRVVRRSNALQDWAYGRDFRYREVTGFGSGPAAPVRAGLTAAALAGAAAVLASKPARRLFRPLIPDPGQGPSEKRRRTGYFDIEVHTRTSGGARYVSKVAARGDPGYQATSVMLGESALCLAAQPPGTAGMPDRAGVLTPATAMGNALVSRLKAAGMTLTAARA